MLGNNTDIPLRFEYKHQPIIIISSAGLFLNALLLIAFVKDPLKCFRNSGTYLVISLAVYDFLLCFYASLIHVIVKEIVAIPTLELFASLLGNCSIFSLVSISIDRFLMVAYPLKHRVFITGKVMILWIAAIPLMSFVISVITTLNARPVQFDKIQGFLIYAIIIVFSIMMYALTYYKLKKQSRNLALQNSSERRAQETRILKEKRFLNTILIIACIAVVCAVFPLLFFAIYNILSLGMDSLAIEILVNIITAMYFLNFAANPPIYFTRLPNYRKTFCLLFCGRST